MNISLFYGLLKDKYGLELEKNIDIMELTSAKEVQKFLNIDTDISKEFILAHTISINYEEYRRILDGCWYS
jgi:hypothetical protein